MDLWMHKYFDYRHFVAAVADNRMKNARNNFDLNFYHRLVARHRSVDVVAVCCRSVIDLNCGVDRLAHCVPFHNQFATAVVLAVDFETCLA